MKRRKALKKTVVRFLFAASFAAALTPAWGDASRGGDQGYGLIIGNPTGLSAKVWFSNVWAIDGAMGVARSEFDTHLTLLGHNFEWGYRTSDDSVVNRILRHGELPFYFGMGPRVLFEDKTELGIRFPLGLSYLPHASTWEFFAEIAPVVRLTPDAGVNGDFGVGVRYYFKSIRPRVGAE